METAESKSGTVGANSAEAQRSPWFWVPSLYFAQGIPFVAVNTLSVILYKRLGLSNTEIALYTSWFYLPWVIKPLWSPLVEIFRTKRFWIVFMQLIVGAGLAGVALTIPASNFVKYTLAFFYLLAFSSATHDIAADGFYMLGLSKHLQAWFVGVRSTFFRLAMITGQGLLVMLAGTLEDKTGLPPVEIPIYAKADGSKVTSIDPASVNLERSEGDLRILAHPKTLEIQPVTRDKAEIGDLVASVKKWNQEHGFYSVEKPVETKPSWWERNVSKWWRENISQPLANSLRKMFPKDTATPSAHAGNIGVVYFYLNKPVEQGQSLVVNFGREADFGLSFKPKQGGKSLKLLEGERFVFNEKNWDKPFAAVVQLDPKLTGEMEAVYVARSGNIPLAWSITFFILAGLFVLFCAYHYFALPKPASDHATRGGAANALAAFFETLASFFRKPGALLAIAFILCYRFAEAQLVKLAGPFLLDAREVGGLALTTGAVGFVYGTVGVLSLTLGGILGGFAAARNGLKFWLPAMVCAINLPNLVYVYLAMAQPDDFVIINTCVAIEQFGYGFGFAAFLLYMIYFAEGEHKTAHYAICTGFMALGMMIPGMFSGWLQDIIGYKNFFVWVIIATIPSFLVAFLVKVDPEFGKKSSGK